MIALPIGGIASLLSAGAVWAISHSAVQQVSELLLQPAFNDPESELPSIGCIYPAVDGAGKRSG